MEAKIGGFLFILLVVLGAIVGLLVYFLPFVVALFRRHHNKMAIFLLNLLLGWSFIGWVIALVWSFTAVDKRENTSRSRVGKSEKSADSPSEKSDDSKKSPPDDVIFGDQIAFIPSITGFLNIPFWKQY